MTGKGNDGIGQKYMVRSLPVQLISKYIQYLKYGVDFAATSHSRSSRATVVTAGSRTRTYLRRTGCHGRKTHEAPMPASQLASSLSPLGLGVELGILAFSHALSTRATGRNSAFHIKRWQSEQTAYGASQPHPAGFTHISPEGVQGGKVYTPCSRLIRLTNAPVVLSDRSAMGYGTCKGMMDAFGAKRAKEGNYDI